MFQIIFQKLKFIFLKNHTLSFADVSKFTFKLIFYYGIYFLTLLLSALGQIPKEQSLGFNNYMYMLGGALILVIFDYLRGNFTNKKPNAKLRHEEQIFDLIGGSIDVLHQMKCKDGNNSDHYTESVLRNVERAVTLILKQLDMGSIGNISANLMVKGSNPDGLILTHFGTYVPGRKKITIPIIPHLLIPGAPEACLTQKTIYIKDIRDPEFKNIFDESKSYRSIISFPIIRNNGDVYGVLNIDSTLENQFISKDIINKKIIPKIEPFVLLLLFERDELIGRVDLDHKDINNN